LEKIKDWNHWKLKFEEEFILSHKFHSAFERISNSVSYLASSSSNMIKRLEVTYQSHLIMISPDEFKSNHAKELFTKIMQPITDRKMVGGVLSSLSVEEAEEIAKNIVALMIQIDHFDDSDF
jgi:hypothetical protein